MADFGKIEPSLGPIIFGTKWKRDKLIFFMQKEEVSGIEMSPKMKDPIGIRKCQKQESIRDVPMTFMYGSIPPPQFSVPQIEYPLGDSSKTGSHVYFLLIVVAMVLLL